MDILFIKELTVMATIGIYEKEKNCLQKLLFDIEMDYDIKKAAYSNNLKDCINYVDVVNEISHYLNNKTFSLIENVAENIAKKLIIKFNLNWISVKLIKPNALLEANSVGIKIIRNRNQYHI